MGMKTFEQVLINLNQPMNPLKKPLYDDISTLLEQAKYWAERNDTVEKEMLKITMERIEKYMAGSLTISEPEQQIHKIHRR
jgi:hypothetical protein